VWFGSLVMVDDRGVGGVGGGGWCSLVLFCFGVVLCCVVLFLVWFGLVWFGLVVRFVVLFFGYVVRIPQLASYRIGQ
jgi:hypothetical protein